MYHIAQLILAILLLACIGIEVVAHAIMGHIASPGSWFVSIIMLALAAWMLGISIKEMRDEKHGES